MCWSKVAAEGVERENADRETAGKKK